MVARDGNLKLVGGASVKQARGILMELLELSEEGNTITDRILIIYLLSMENRERRGC